MCGRTQDDRELEWERGKQQGLLDAARGGIGVHVWYCRNTWPFSNLQASGRLPVWTRDYLRKAAVVGLGCAIVVVFVAVQLRLGARGTGTYLALSVLWVVALWLAGGCDLHFVGRFWRVPQGPRRRGEPGR